MNFERAKIKRIVTPEAALMKLMALTSRAEKCSGDAIRLMTRWEIPEREQAKIIERLISERWIDDSRYAAAFVRDKSTYSSWGYFKIKNALRTKGISKDIIDSALETISDETSSENLTKILTKKMSSTKAKNDYDMKGKLFRYAMSKGYQYEDIVSVLDDLI